MEPVDPPVVDHRFSVEQARQRARFPRVEPQGRHGIRADTGRAAERREQSDACDQAREGLHRQAVGFRPGDGDRELARDPGHWWILLAFTLHNAKARDSKTPVQTVRADIPHDKFGLMIRIETTTYDVSFFRHYRQVEHRNGFAEMKYTTMKKMRRISGSSRCYCTVSSTSRASETVAFAASSPRRPQVSRILKRLRCHGLAKKVARNYKYHLTTIGRAVASLALQLRIFLVTPALAQITPARS
jgi:hypothetical protein